MSLGTKEDSLGSKEDLRRGVKPLEHLNCCGMFSGDLDTRKLPADLISVYLFFFSFSCHLPQCLLTQLSFSLLLCFVFLYFQCVLENLDI